LFAVCENVRKKMKKKIVSVHIYLEMLTLKKEYKSTSGIFQVEKKGLATEMNRTR
jgi:hypothetical protein